MAKAGRWVWNLVDVSLLVSDLMDFLVVPVMASPVLVTLTTLPASTWSRKVL